MNTYFIIIKKGNKGVDIEDSIQAHSLKEAIAIFSSHLTQYGFTDKEIEDNIFTQDEDLQKALHNDYLEAEATGN